MFSFDSIELKRFDEGLIAACAIPFIDDIEDYVVEALLKYSKGIEGHDPFFETRKKLLFDVVDETNHVGWSVKSININKKTIEDCNKIEVVIMRADVYKKAEQLGFSALDKNSDPQDIGTAVLKLWNNKINEDSIKQNVQDRRVFVLIKNNQNKKYLLYQPALKSYSPCEIEWRWTDDNKDGLQGMVKSTKQLVYRWYPGGKHLFEDFYFDSEEIQCVAIEPKRLEINLVVNHILELLK